MKESVKIQTKYAYVKGYISADTLIKTFAKCKITVTPENIAWLNSPEGRQKAIEDYERLVSFGAAQRKADLVSKKYDQAKKIFND